MSQQGAKWDATVAESKQDHIRWQGSHALHSPATKCGLVWFPTQMSQLLGPQLSICHKICINRELWMSRIHMSKNDLDVATAAATMHNTKSCQCHNWKKCPWHMTWWHHCLTPNVIYHQVQNSNLYLIVLCICLVMEPRRSSDHACSIVADVCHCTIYGR